MTSTEQNDKLIETNRKLLFILGVVASVILDLRKYVPEKKEQGILWILEAIENVVYQDNQLPPFLDN